MRTRRCLSVLVAIACALSATLATADPTALGARWTERWGLFKKRSASFELACTGGGGWQAEVRSPRKQEPRRVTLRHVGAAGWQLTVERRVQVSGLEDVIGGEAGGWTWGKPETFALAATGDRLEGHGFSIDAPAGGAVVVDGTAPGAEPGGALGEPSTSALPVVRVLITGFDRFPRPANHPTYFRASVKTPGINPSGWAVRNFDPATLDPALRQRVRVEVHRMNDVPVEYVEGARAICEQIQAIDADVAISFGVGADGGADADVESTCSNLMHDGSAFGSDEEGPFVLPGSWPPAGPESSWSEEDRAWLWRYPDNAGVSYNRKRIDPTAPETLRSSLPVSQIVQRVQREGLSAHDGMGGPGQYICNNVMFKVVDAQQRRGKLGGFIHVASWSESRRQSYLTVLRCAIEESVKNYLETAAAGPTN